MTTVTLSITESNLFATLGSFLTSILPVGTPVLRAQANRAAETAFPNFVMMTPVLRNKLGMNWTAFSDGYPNNPQVQTNLNPTDVQIQLDIHGPLAADNTQIITTMFWSGWACDQFAAAGFDITPLFNDDPHEVPYMNDQQQIEMRWVTTLHMQVNAVATVTQQFAAQLAVGVISVEATYHP